MIFDGTKQGISFLPKERIGWPMGIYFPTVNGKKDFSQLDVGSVAAGLADVPLGANLCPDVEGDPNKDDGQELWDYNTHPETALFLRLSFLEEVKRQRPDLKVGLYSIPWQVSDDMLARETAYKAITEISDVLYITAYPKPNETLEDWDERLRRKVGCAYWLHGMVPRVLVTHETQRTEIGYAEFSARLKVIRTMGLDAIYWVSQSSEIPWWVRLALYSEAMS